MELDYIDTSITPTAKEMQDYQTLLIQFNQQEQELKFLRDETKRFKILNAKRTKETQLFKQQLKYYQLQNEKASRFTLDYSSSQNGDKLIDFQSLYLQIKQENTHLKEEILTMSERTQIETPEISRSKSTQRQLFNIDLIDEVRKVYSVFRAYELQEIKLNLSAFKGQCVRNINAFKLQGLYKRMKLRQWE